MEPRAKHVRMRRGARVLERERRVLHCRERRLSVRVRAKHTHERGARIRAERRIGALRDREEEAEPFVTSVEVVRLVEQRAEAADGRREGLPG